MTARAAWIVASFLLALTSGCALWGGKVRDDGGARPPSLLGTRWRLENLGGLPVDEKPEVTLEFPEEGRVAGSGSCNRFFGSVRVAGDSILFGAIGATRMACSEGVMEQEAKYFDALQGPHRFETVERRLTIHAGAGSSYLTFVRIEH